MEDVTGFNQKNSVNDGEKLVEAGLKKLRQRYSDHIIEIIRLMLKYDEGERPSFVELAKLVLTSTENTIESPKNGQPKKQPVGNKTVSKAFSSQSLKDKDGNPINQQAPHDAIDTGNKKMQVKSDSRKNVAQKRGDSAKSTGAHNQLLS